MPELPEVETVKNDLRPRLVGRSFASVTVKWPRMVLPLSPEELCRRLVGRKVEEVVRRGKNLVLRLYRDRGSDSEDGAVAFHLMMTGALLLRPPATPPDPFTQAVFTLDDGSELRFCDRRKFGTMRLLESEDALVGKLGPDPLDPSLTSEALAERLARRKSPVKAVLCDQGVLAGVGNIYSDEALHQARIHPLRPAGSLSPGEVSALHQALREVLRTGISNRGTTFSTFQDAAGEPGHNRAALRVYRRRGEPCYRCGTAIERTVVRNRGAYFCPCCQPLPKA